MDTHSSLQLRPPRERGTGPAFGLAVSLHVVLLALVLAGTKSPQVAPTGPHIVVTGSVTPFLPAAPLPRVASRAWAPRVTAAPARLLAANEPAPVARHRSIATRPTRLHRSALRIARVSAVPRPPPVVEITVAPPRDRPLERERAARLAALQAVAGRPLPASGVSAEYAEKVARRVRANVLAPFDIEGNPSAVIAVTCTPRGALLSVKVERSSGNPQWDRAVVAAVEDSDPMPVDASGSAPTRFVMTFRPKG
ncbi:energy transducer TonB [Paraburkholderia tagetis]|uniref:TonB C-terminal domain-containing protein n=1 Tax=Paraburkholderia tagetis TaxID=2913261 RepID=A0A9X2A0C9_9BURK|nr:energy transducer TonB [Paraburkholderia tagetis]MCG5077990.1 TonB C-terminal domain-containing protein [Paraburkholderia tagetis]